MIRAAAFLAALSAACSQVHAQAPDSRTEELLRVEQTLKDKAAEEKRLKNEAFEREKEVAALRYRMIETANALQSSERRLAGTLVELERLTKEEADLAASLATRRGELGDVLAALQSLELSRPPALLISPDDANKAARAAILLADAAPKLEGRARALRIDLERLQSLRRMRDSERQAAERSKADIGDRRAMLADLLKKKQAERDVAAKMAAAAQRETAALASRATDLREVIRRLKRLARAIAPRLKPPPPVQGEAPSRPPSLSPSRTPDGFAPARPFAKARGTLKPPVVGRIVAAFGSALGNGEKLDGVRFATSADAIVTAPFEASVAFARDWNPVGKLIVLDVGGGYHVLLMGVNMFLVQEGQRVSAGEPLGAMSAPAGAKEAMLDLEIRRNGEPVNPSLWLSKKSLEEMAF